MLKTTIEDQILIANLDNGKTNSFTKETLEKLKHALDQVKKNEKIKGLILTGNGRFFSSGFDLYTFMNFKDTDEVKSFLKYADEVLVDFFVCPKPVICAMNGHTVAGGLIFAMAADFRISTDHPKIKIGMSEIKIGVPLSIAQNAIMKFGFDSHKKFRDIMYFGELMNVTKALEKEIIDKSVKAEELINKAKSIISLWVDNPGDSFCWIKKELKQSTSEYIKKRLKNLKDNDYNDVFKCFFDKEVKQTLAFVQSSMEK
ncbi:MAG: hypothetical protein B6I26_02910 [Desulfobacteraceae bacterium 4572_130]|nr:MAG: hypothetical protein B6I26_02910 [Desulfobacteraceae bacterium 4572_130]